MFAQFPKMKRTVLSVIILGFTAVSMGISMPSCPGQQAMQQQIDALQTKNAELEKKVQAMNTQVTAFTQELTDTKNLVSQMGLTIQTQKEAMDQMDLAIKAATAPKPAAKPAAKPRKR